MAASSENRQFCICSAICIWGLASYAHGLVVQAQADQETAAVTATGAAMGLAGSEKINAAQSSYFLQVW